MSSWNIWLLYYLVPAMIGTAVAYKKPAARRMLLIHFALIVSMLLIISTGLRLDLHSSLYAYLFFIVGATAAISLLGWQGLAYALSSVVQEWSMLLAALIIGPTVAGVALTALVYSLAHLISPLRWKTTLPITLAWGICSIALYFWIRQPALNMAIHLIGGVILFRSEVI